MYRGNWSYFKIWFSQGNNQSDIYHQNSIKFKEGVKQKSKTEVHDIFPTLDEG